MPRKGFSAEELARHVAQVTADDRTSPPTREVSLSDVVRALWPNIQARRAAGQPFSRIADWLGTLGYEISAATLCVYWHRVVRDSEATDVIEGARPPPALAISAPQPRVSPNPLLTPARTVGAKTPSTDIALPPEAPTRPKLPKQIA